jgi:SAM-dependent methyltransferase
MTASAKSELYAPVYFGDGIKVGRLWSIDSGFGRWHYILKHNLSSFAGKRILDLGANNGSVSLEMLRAGARESVAVELNNKAIEQGKFLKDAFEWHDNKQYNFKYVRANMRDIIGIDLGRFDIVMALCSIYYLNDYEISRVIKHISTISNVLVLQCNLARDIERADEYTYKKASVEYTVGLLRNNGFPVIRVVAPKYYDRPLVIGEKNHI